MFRAVSALKGFQYKIKAMSCACHSFSNPENVTATDPV